MGNIPEEQRIELAGIIFNEVRRLNEMTSLFLDLARLESGRAGFKLSFFDVSPLINECCLMMQGLAAENQVTINQLITPELPAIQADRDKTKQVLLNLLNKAIKYNRRNGEITLLAASDGTEMVITVRDTGIGIPSAAMPHLFEKFFRVIGSEKIASGTGLGLSFCWQIVQARRGHIEVNSQVDKGTEFIIHLPLRQG